MATGNTNIVATNFLNNSPQYDSYLTPKLITIDFTTQINTKVFYDAVDGIVFNDGSVKSIKDFKLSFEPDLNGNAHYKGFFNNKHHINFDIGDYEMTIANIRALTIHEGYGHGVKGYHDDNKNHYKAYQASIDSRYWESTTYKFKYHAVTQMWTYYYYEVGNQRMPVKYQAEYDKYNKYRR